MKYGALARTLLRKGENKGRTHALCRSLKKHATLNGRYRSVPSFFDMSHDASKCFIFSQGMTCTTPSILYSERYLKWLGVRDYDPQSTEAAQLLSQRLSKKGKKARFPGHHLRLYPEASYS